ncbi:MAG: hypothetical protein O2897_00250 [bacterium]|nr:hypothetical protein [bacterium]
MPSNTTKYFIAALLFSLALHCFLFGLLFYSWSNSSLIDLDKQIVQIHLTKLGKKPDEKLLPRLDVSKNTETPSVPLQKIVKEQTKVKEVAKKPIKEAAAEKKPKSKSDNKPKETKPIAKSTKSDTANKNNPLDVLKKRFGEARDEGTMKGSVLGESLSEELAENYALQVAALIKQSYELPAILKNRQKELLLWVRLKINAQGELIKVEILKTSGESIFDNG